MDATVLFGSGRPLDCRPQGLSALVWGYFGTGVPVLLRLAHFRFPADESCDAAAGGKCRARAPLCETTQVSICLIIYRGRSSRGICSIFRCRRVSAVVPTVQQQGHSNPDRNIWVSIDYRGTSCSLRSLPQPDPSSVRTAISGLALPAPVISFASLHGHVFLLHL